MDKTKDENVAKIFCSKRLLLAMLGFLGSFQLYSMRISLSVGILCMTNLTALNNMEPVHNKSNELLYQNVSSNCLTERGAKHKDGPFLWDKDKRGLILGVFFWGYVFTQIPAGYLASRYSAKWFLFSSLLIGSITMAAMPLATYGGIWLVVVLRIICGIVSGFWFPCMHQLWSAWAPPSERSLLVGLTYSGLHVGNAISLPLAGLLCESDVLNGWPLIFYVSGIFGGLWCVLWGIFAQDSPNSSKGISIKERIYIENSLKYQVDDDKSKHAKFLDIPWLDIVKSKPFWAIAIINITFDWNGYTFITSTPTYMMEVLKFNMSQNGFVSALPYIGMGIAQVFFSLFANFLQNRVKVRVAVIRKTMSCIGQFVPAVVVLILAYLQCEMRILAVVLLTIGLSSTSALFVGPFVNHVDIAPQYAGLLFGLTNTMGAFTGFFSSYFVQSITYNKTIEQWRIVFFVCAAIYFFGAAFYAIFASGTLEEWARPDNAKDIKTPLKEEEEEEKKV